MINKKYYIKGITQEYFNVKARNNHKAINYTFYKLILPIYNIKLTLEMFNFKKIK